MRRKTLWLIAAAVSACASAARATDYTWNNPASSAWDTPGNWTPSGPPGSGDTATLTNSAANVNISLGGVNRTIDTLKFTGVSPSFNPNTIGGTFTLNKIRVEGSAWGNVNNGVIAAGPTLNLEAIGGPLRLVSQNAWLNANNVNITTGGTSNQYVQIGNSGFLGAVSGTITLNANSTFKIDEPSNIGNGTASLVLNSGARF